MVKLLVKVLSGGEHNVEEHNIEVDASATLGELKQVLFHRLGREAGDTTARVVLKGQELKGDSSALADSGVTDGAMLCAVIKEAGLALSTGPASTQQGRGDKAAADSPGGAATSTQTRARQQASTRLEKSGTAHGLLLEVRRGNLCHEEVDAIVNAANERMSHGAGVAKAISRGSGQFDSDDDSIVDRESADWIHDHKRLETGRMAAITSAGNLPCKWVVHVAGPIFPVGTEDRDRKREARDLLRGAVMAALHKADEHECSSVALPAISSGIFGFPLKLCARILVESSVEFASQARFLKRISFTNIDEKTTNAMAEAFEKFGPPSMQADASGHPPSVPPTRRLDPLGGSEGSPSKRRRPDGLREEAGAVGLAKGVAEGDGGETSKCSSPSAPPAVSARVSTESHTKKAKPEHKDPGDIEAPESSVNVLKESEAGGAAEATREQK